MITIVKLHINGVVVIIEAKKNRLNLNLPRLIFLKMKLLMKLLFKIKIAKKGKFGNFDSLFESDECCLIIIMFVCIFCTIFC